MRPIKMLLIEDDDFHCLEYADYINTQNRPIALRTAQGCRDGLPLLKSFNPDVVLLDLMLNRGDGTGIDFLKRCRDMPLKTIPYVVVITDVLAKQTHRKALELGAGFLFTKTEIDYSPQKVVDYVLNFFEDNAPKKTCKNDEKKRIAEALEQVGISYDMDGREYLIEAIFLSMQREKINLNRDIYPVLAKEHTKSEQSIRKAIENAIHKAWELTDINILKKHYTAQTSYISGVPSNKQFICYYAYKLGA